jgi:hypothetical protein
MKATICRVCGVAEWGHVCVESGLVRVAPGALHSNAQSPSRRIPDRYTKPPSKVAGLPIVPLAAPPGKPGTEPSKPHPLSKKGLRHPSRPSLDTQDMGRPQQAEPAIVGPSILRPIQHPDTPDTAPLPPLRTLAPSGACVYCDARRVQSAARVKVHRGRKKR